MNNTEKTIKNSIISVAAQIITLLLQFVNRRVFILFLDIEYLGYQTLFSNIFSLLSVAELGIGNIIVFHMYKEIINRNDDEIGKLMYLYKWLYRIVASVVCVAGIIFYFLIPYYVKDASASLSYLRLVYGLQLIGVVLGYFLSYKRTLFIASQQEYKCVKIDLIVTIVVQILQVVVLALFQNFILYLCVQLSTTIIANLIISYRYNKEFPNLRKKYGITKEYIKSLNLFADMRDLLVHRISYAVYSGTDNIIISAFCGVRSVALYGNYVIVQKGVMQVLFYKLLNPVQATIGNIVYGQRTKQVLWKQFEMLDVFSYFFATYIGIGFLVFYQPFIELWMGSEYLLSNAFVVLFSLTIYLCAVWEIVYKYRCLFGDYRQDRNLMLLSAILNVAISIIGVKTWGIEGVQIGTLIAYLPIGYGRIRFIVKNYFQQSIAKYLLKHCCLLALASLEATLCFSVCQSFPVTILGLCERAVICIIIPLVINCAVYWKNDDFWQMVHYFKRILNILKNKIFVKT